MSTNNGSNGVAMEAMMRPLLEFWNQSIAASAEHAKVLLDSVQGAQDLDTIRRRWLDALAKNMDGFMRSPVFLEGLRRNFDAMTLAKSTQEDAAQEVSQATGIPRIQDISGLFERMQVGQEAIMERLRSIEKRLETLEKRVKKANG